MTSSPQVLPSRLLIVVLALAAIFLLFSTRVQADEPLIVSERIVMQGDTLWGIAASITDPGEDVRSTIAELKRINGLPTSSLDAGQVLLIPSG
jgi:nucleoid-associated protein YgaU